MATDFEQVMLDAQEDATSLSEFIYQPAGFMVERRLAPPIHTLEFYIDESTGRIFENGGLPATPYKTKTLMEASAQVDGEYAQVTDDTINNGLYYKEGGVWVKSEYDPLTKAKEDATIKANTAKQESIDSAVILAASDATTKSEEVVELLESRVSLSSRDENLIEARDSNGIAYLIVTKDAEYKLLGLDGDLVGIVNALRDSNTSLSPLLELITSKETSGLLLEAIDVNGKQTIRQGANGHVYLPHIGNLTQTVLDLAAKKKANELVDVGTKYTDYALANNVTDSQQNLSSLLKAIDFDALNLVAHDVGVLRLPAITRLSQYKFLVFFDAMPAQNDFGVISTCRMTVDIDPITYALTKSNIAVTHEAFDDNGTQRNFIQSVGVKTNSGKVICIYTRRHEQSEHELYMRTSTDDGVTFSEFTDISYVKNDAGLNGMFACSQGFVKRYGKHKGRIIFPIWTTGAGYLQSEYLAGFIYSDDDGLTWQIGKLAPYSTGNEVQAAEDINGDMLFSIRVQTGDNKIIARYSDITDEYTRLYTDTVITYDAVMSGLIQGDNKYDFSPAKFTLATARNADRTEMLIHTSYDGGKTWATKFVNALANKPVAYVSLDNITATHKLFVWESGGVKDLDYSVMTIDNFIKGDL